MQSTQREEKTHRLGLATKPSCVGRDNKRNSSDSGLDSSGDESMSARDTQLTSIEVEANRSALDANVSMLEDDINTFFDSVICALEKRKRDLVQRLDDIKNDKLLNDIDCKGNRLRFFSNDYIFSAIDECGDIDEKRACHQNSHAGGIGLKYAICNETTHFALKTCNKHGELSWVEQDKVHVSMRKDKEQCKCIIQNNCNGMYDVFYEVSEPGCYEINIQVNGAHLKGSPYKCCVFEKHDLKFKVQENTPELLIKNGDKTALLEKTEFHRSSKLYSNVGALARAWKVRVTIACPKIKLKFGYCQSSTHIPDLCEEYFCKFDLNELKVINNTSTVRQHHKHHHRHHHRKQSTFQRTSLTFVVIEDVNESVIHVAVEGTNIEKLTSFKGESQSLIPFIGVKHVCHNPNCPRPTLVFV